MDYIKNKRRHAFHDELKKLAQDSAPLKDLLAGAGSGLATSAIVAPLERTYNLQQIATKGKQSHP